MRFRHMFLEATSRAGVALRRVALVFVNDVAGVNPEYTL